MKHAVSTLLSRTGVARTTALTLALTTAVSASALAQETPPNRVDEGIVEFEIDYEDLGPMGAMLPKSERVLFRPGQVRVESGINTTLYGVVPGRTVQLMDMPPTKLAFLIPRDTSNETESPIRYEIMPDRRTIAGLSAHRIDRVDREDETNRSTYWSTDQLAINFPVESNRPEGFALDYTIFINDGVAHKVATSFRAESPAANLFAISDEYRQIEINSASEIGKHLSEIMGDSIEVVE